MRFEELRSEAYVAYDAAAYDFRALVGRMLLSEAERAAPLETLHDVLASRGVTVELVTFATDQATPVHKAFYQSPLLPEFDALYQRFVADVVAKQFDEDVLVFQARPTFRVSLPGNLAVGCKHRDGDYLHPRGEINFWLPMTKVWGSNGFFTETAPERGDFHPIELGVGQMFRFYGNQCWHYNEINSTGSTRVSCDFRVIPLSRWNEEHMAPAPARADQAQPTAAAGSVKSGLKFQVGGYYAVLDRRTGAISRDLDDVDRLQREFGLPVTRGTHAPPSA